MGWLLGGGSADDERLAAGNAGEAMTAPAVTIAPTTAVAQAARRMTDHGIKRLPVVNAEGPLVGIVTRSDLVRAFARRDDVIAHEIREDVVRRTLWIDRAVPDIVVENGEVTISGEVENRSDAELLELFAARVPGVVSVRSTVTWRWDDEKGSQVEVPRVPPVPR
jgi:CBS domain-containing protein